MGLKDALLQKKFFLSYFIERQNYREKARGRERDVQSASSLPTAPRWLQPWRLGHAQGRIQKLLQVSHVHAGALLLSQA